MTLGRIILSVITSLSSIAVYSATENNYFIKKDLGSAYSIKNFVERKNTGDYTIILALSGGGTRAAALSYGVLKALRTETLHQDSYRSLLDEVDVISSVSGGSFTAAYYGLYGEKIFDDFEEKFLYADVDGDLVSTILDPTEWLSSDTRTEKAIKYYQNKLFKGSTFSDLKNANGPMIIINATDIGNSVRFSFLQEYFDPLCSELSTYPVANAVAASSAVPIVFNSVVLKNHDTCDTSFNRFLDGDHESISPITKTTVEGLIGYREKERKKFVHLVDGGITDNLGLLSLYDTAQIGGSGLEFFEKENVKRSSHYLIISVDASAVSDNAINQSEEELSIRDTVTAMSNIQFLRYNTSTRKLIQDWMQEHVERYAKRGVKIEPYFININFSSQAIVDDERRRFLNNIPTALSLEKEQVDEAILEGYYQLQNHPDFIRFINNISNEQEVMTK